jgi:hypothetical protein
MRSQGGHQGIGREPGGVPRLGLVQHPLQRLVVVILLQQRHPRHRAMEHVIDQAAGRMTGDSRDAASLTPKSPAHQAEKSCVPFSSRHEQSAERIMRENPNGTRSGAPPRNSAEAVMHCSRLTLFHHLLPVAFRLRAALRSQVAIG